MIIMTQNNDNVKFNSNNYSKTSGSQWQYYRDEPAINAGGNIIDFFNIAIDSISFKLKKK